MVAGVVLLCAVAADVFSTVFVPRGGAGWLTSRLHHRVWVAWSALVCAGGRRRRRLLALAGPALLPLTIALWVLGVVVAFALVYLPYAGQLAGPSGELRAGWVSALYVSAYSAVTLGVGDVYASTGPLRLLVTAEAALGFGVFTAAITYVLSVYGALLRATALSLSITTFVGRQAGEDAVDVACRTVRTASEAHVLTWLTTTVADLSAAAQALRQYPMVAYFHVPDDGRALPLAMSDLLELLTVCRALLDPAEQPGLSSSPTTLAAWRMSTTFVGENAARFGSTPRADDDDGARAVQEYEDVRARLVEAGVPVRSDGEARDLYLQLRGQWRASGQRVLRHFRYDPL